MLVGKRTPGSAAGLDWAFVWSFPGQINEVPDEVGRHLIRDSNGYSGFFEVSAEEPCQTDFPGGTVMSSPLDDVYPQDDLRGALTISGAPRR